jgi:hypothetical protein
VFDPAGARKMLREFTLRERDGATALVEQQRP